MVALGGGLRGREKKREGEGWVRVEGKRRKRERTVRRRQNRDESNLLPLHFPPLAWARIHPTRSSPRRDATLSASAPSSRAALRVRAASSAETPDATTSTASLLASIGAAAAPDVAAAGEAVDTPFDDGSVVHHGSISRDVGVATCGGS